MAHRRFCDSQGKTWEAWAVSPAFLERRREPNDEPPTADRRKKLSFRQRVSPQWALGWLAFETRGDKRRLAPFPADWFRRSDSELEQLCANAQRVGQRRRLLG